MARFSIRGVQWVLRLALAALAMAFVAGCGVSAGEQGSRLTVFAASSLTDAFEELGERFEKENPGTEVRFSFAGSSVLLTQLRQGAPADVFASADEEKMEAAAEAGLVSKPRTFARNRPVVLVPADNAAGISGLRDLAEPEVDLVLAQDGVPVAEYARVVLERAGGRYGKDFERRVLGNLVSREADVRAAASKIALGEADATFAYASDVTPDLSGWVGVVEIPSELNVVATYPIAAVEGAANPGLAREWLDLVSSQEGQRVLEEWGFQRADR